MQYTYIELSWLCEWNEKFHYHTGTKSWYPLHFLSFKIISKAKTNFRSKKKGRYSLQSKIISAFEVNCIGFLYTYVLHFFPDFSELYGWSKEEKNITNIPLGHFSAKKYTILTPWRKIWVSLGIIGSRWLGCTN